MESFIKKFENGFLFKTKEHEYLCLSGTAYERGRQEGYLLSEQTLQTLQSFRFHFSHSFQTLGKCPVFFTRLLAVLYYFTLPKEDKITLRGFFSGVAISQHAEKIAFLDICYINSFPDCLIWLQGTIRAWTNWIPKIEKPLISKEVPVHCNSFAAWNDSDFIAAQNVDFLLKWPLPTLLVIERPNKGYGRAGIKSAGTVGYFTAINEWGLSYGEVGVHTYPCYIHTSWQIQMARSILFSKTPLEAARQIKKVGYGHHYFYAGIFKKKEAGCLEAFASHLDWTESKDETLFFRTEFSLSRGGRKEQLRFREKENWRSYISFLRQRHRMLKHALGLATRTGFLTLEKAKKTLSRTSFADNLAQVVYENQKSILHFRVSQGILPATKSEWVSCPLYPFWVKMHRMAADPERICIEKSASPSPVVQYQLKYNGKEQRTFSLKPSEKCFIEVPMGESSIELFCIDTGQTVCVL